MFTRRRQGSAGHLGKHVVHHFGVLGVRAEQDHFRVLHHSNAVSRRPVEQVVLDARLLSPVV